MKAEGIANVVELDYSRLYGFKILDGKARAALSSKIGGGKVTKPEGPVLGSKLGVKPGLKVV